MSTTFVWLVKIVCLAGSGISTWYFLQTVFPPALFSIVPIGWICFEVGVILWPKYTFSKDRRTFGQRITGLVMTFVAFAGVAACFIGNVLILGPDHALFMLTDSMKALDVYIVVGVILLTILCAILVTSVIPHFYLFDAYQPPKQLDMQYAVTESSFQQVDTVEDKKKIRQKRASLNGSEVQE